MKISKHQKYPTIVIGFLLFLICQSGFAAESSPHSVGLMVGQVWPNGNIGQDVDSSVAPGLTYEYAASDVFSVYYEGIKSSHSDGALKLFSNAVGIKSHLIYIDKLAPYAMLGAGLYFVKKAFGTETSSKTNFGIHIGLGAELDVSEKVFLGLEFDVHNLFASHDTLPRAGKQEISGRSTGFFLRGGMRF